MDGFFGLRVEITIYGIASIQISKDCNRVVFVEGPDDLHFWNHIAIRSNINPIHFEDVGGSEELNIKVESIVNGDAKIIVARDSDHSSFLIDSLEHPRIVHSYGYSIENSLYCPDIINRFISQLSRQLDDYTEIIKEWYKDFCYKIKGLLAYDIANHRYEKGIKIFGDNCMRFLKKPNSPEISSKKIQKFIIQVEDHFSDHEIEHCKKLIDQDERDIRWLVKGHFLTNAVINLIKKIVFKYRKKNITLSLDHLYSHTINGCASCAPEGCFQLNNMVDNFKEAVISINSEY